MDIDMQYLQHLGAGLTTITAALWMLKQIKDGIKPIRKPPALYGEIVDIDMEVYLGRKPRAQLFQHKSKPRLFR